MAAEPKILVVDDEVVVITSAERVLKSEGYRIEGALGGREAILRIEQGGYDLVFTDLKMPARQAERERAKQTLREP